ncbi:hypothetical protein LSUE1_G006929 [Lachnellula suecica]|uniref:BTB domain-containing protein n=1 Tax=Lachnellula suecica TaxID=602035 RepID=A0A8T9BVP4_9HELO|nr:hypothetical protein LSUE1_G006929 [Lachnellula suecica]
MSKMHRLPSHASSSNSTSSPKARSRFFFKRDRGLSSSTNVSQSDVTNGDTNKDEDKIPSSPFHMNLPELELSRSNGFPSPDPYVAATHDAEYLHLKDNTRRIRKAPSGSDPKKVDNAWEVYKKVRDECLQLCQSLLLKSQNFARNDPPSNGNDSAYSSRAGSTEKDTSTPLPLHVNDQWLAAILEYKTSQEHMLENLTNSLLATYKSYEPNLSQRQKEAFLTDKMLRKNMIAKWRDTSVHAMKSEKLLFWEQYKIRSLNLERLTLDLKATKRLFEVAEPSGTDDTTIQEYVIAKNGDTILEFPNKSLLDVHPVLRFRVSSHLLAESSPFFSHMLLTRSSDDVPLDMENQLPPAPIKQNCKDGTEVKVYRMPQIEHNKHDALTILLHAAHMHNAKVPREIEFPVFISIAEICLRYHCTSPLELQVEYQWLPQWYHKAADERPDGLLLISFAFGIRRIFTRVSKTAILNAVNDAEIQSKELWPQVVRDKIKAIRSAKLAQIQECCISAIEEYFRPPSSNISRKASVGSLVMTTVPRCPKGSHLCDATNLGWLMLVLNELQALPSIMNNNSFRNLSPSPQRSLKALVDCLRLMPSAPQVHSGVCDYAPAFRSAIDDIYNSISGLTLRDVTGRNGWALSKHAGPTEDRYDDRDREAVELEAPLKLLKKSKRSRTASNESISLQILSYIDDLDDLSSAAMIDKSFYSAYKRNEASLLRNVMKAERKRTMSHVGPELLRFKSSTSAEFVKPRLLSVSTSTDSTDSKSLKSEQSKAAPPPRNIADTAEDLYDVSPQYSPLTSEAPMSAEEAERILWPKDSLDNSVPNTITKSSEKFRMGNAPQKSKPLERGLSRIENKARMMDDDKHLREEKDKFLGIETFKERRQSADNTAGCSEPRPYDSRDYI